MINKLSILFVFTSILGFNISGFSQSLVSTDIEKRNVILEEYTGRNCIYCPNGHALAAQLEEAYPEDLFVIARHAGGFSPTDYPNLNLPESDSIRAYYDITSFPNGTINREMYQGSGPDLSLSAWTGAANSIMAQDSYVNVGVEATINPSDRVLTVHYELYYTSDAPTVNNFSIVLVQSGIIGYQIGIGPYYEFNHNPILHSDGVWGGEVTETSSGTLIDQTVSIELPEFFNDVEIDLNHLAVVAYVSEDDNSIISGAGSEVEMNAIYDNDPALTAIQIPPYQCDQVLEPQIEITNTGNDVLTSVDVEYKINSSAVSSYTWTGNLEFLEKTMVDLPAINFSIQENNILEVELINDENDLNNGGQKPFDFAVDVESSFVIEYKTIFQSEENYWEIISSDGEVVLSGDDYGNLGLFEIPINMEQAGCFDFVFYDTEGNGFASPSAYLKIIKDDEVLMEINGDFGSSVIWPFASDYTLDIPEHEYVNMVNIFPNPAKNKAQIESHLEIETVEIYNYRGELVFKQEVHQNTLEIDLRNYISGLYLVKIKAEDKEIITRMFVD